MLGYATSMRHHAAAILVAAFSSIHCGEGPHVVSTPPPPPPNLNMPSDAPTVAQSPPVELPPPEEPSPSHTRVPTNPTSSRRWTNGSSGRTTGGSSVKPAPIATTCTDPPPFRGAVCIQDCGDAVERDDDPPPPFIWVTPEIAKKPRYLRCPICLPEDARIATPQGQVRVVELRVGMPVFSVDEKGKQITTNIERVGSALVPASHKLVRIELSDGRTVRASPGHPTADGRVFGSLHVGDRLDNATIAHLDVVFYGKPRTFDILPTGATGAYWANGVLIGSTLGPTE